MHEEQIIKLLSEERWLCSWLLRHRLEKRYDIKITNKVLRKHLNTLENKGVVKRDPIYSRSNSIFWELVK
ncbi:winged-helix domain-containing protein [Providencia huaxiensis]|uniref:winged-helix domain-containing protein n=1 Tax=Providencia huaxiensis TaxID=2027290 RepID=UPI0032DC5655